jgi:deoxyribodipyrimidine photo-lyase
MDESVPAVDWAEPGTKAAMKQFDFFAKNGLKNFDALRNHPVQKDISSDLSPWINHGHVSFASITNEVKKLNKYANGTASFIEEGVIRRELSDNFVYYSPNITGWTALDG